VLKIRSAPHQVRTHDRLISSTPACSNTGDHRSSALAQFYAKAILASGVQFDMLFGPAYKGIVLAASAGRWPLSREGPRTSPSPSTARRPSTTAKGGLLVGARRSRGRVLIVDDSS